jgi:C-terminal domain on Strawberry notch homologue
VTNVRGERRFISTIARRLDALGALTRGQRQTGGQGLFDPRDNLESSYADASLIQLLRLMMPV